MKKIGILCLGCFLTVAFTACSKTTTTTLGTDEYAYSALTFPNFSTLNPVRYLQVVEYDASVAGVIEHWIIYFKETNDTFASYAIRVNESYEMVRDTTDMLVKTYRIKTGESE